MYVHALRVFTHGIVYVFICLFYIYVTLPNKGVGWHTIRKQNNFFLIKQEKDKKMKQLIRELEYQHKPETPYIISQPSFFC